MTQGEPDEGRTIHLRQGLIGVLAILLAVLCLPAAQSQAQPASPAAAPAAPQSRDGGRVYSFAFKDAPIAQVTEEVLGATLGVSYAVDPAVTGTMTFRLEDRLTRAQLLAAFEAALAAYDVVLVENGGQMLVTPRARARNATGVSPYAESRRSPGYEIWAVPLSYATPSEMARVFQATGPANVVVHVDDKLGLILLGGSSRELALAVETLRMFDRSGLEAARLRYFELSQAPANVVAQELERVLSASGASGTHIVPLKRLNALVVIARTPQALDEVSSWVTKLDVPSREEASSLWIYRPRNLTAETLSQTLNSVLGGVVQVASSSSPPGPTGDAAAGTATAASPSSTLVTSGEDQVRVGVDKESNTLLIAAPASRWVQIQRVLEQIDRTPDQVLIEASILEVTLTNELRFGIDWTALANAGKIKISSIGNEQGAVAPRFPGLSVTFLDDDLRAAVNALGAQTDVEVVSAPKLVVLDNRTARLQVGDQVPVSSQTARGTDSADAPLVVTTEYRNTGVILEVTPRINGDNTIVLQVSQEVSSVARTTSSGIDSPTIQQRRLESTLILRDGGTIALGGLISTTRTRGDAGIPFLKDIPGLGQVFKNDTRDARRTELVVLLTARVVRGGADNTAFVAEFLADMREIEARGLLGR